MSGFPDVAGAIVAFAGALVALGVIGKWVRSVYRTLKRVNAMIDEIMGDKAANPARPGWGMRLTGIEKALKDHMENHVPPAPRPINNAR